MWKSSCDDKHFLCLHQVSYMKYITTYVIVSDPVRLAFDEK